MDDMPEELAEPELTVAAPGFDHSLIADDVIAASESSLNSLAQWSTITAVHPDVTSLFSIIKEQSRTFYFALSASIKVAEQEKCLALEVSKLFIKLNAGDDFTQISLLSDSSSQAKKGADASRAVWSDLRNVRRKLNQVQESLPSVVALIEKEIAQIPKSVKAEGIFGVKLQNLQNDRDHLKSLDDMSKVTKSVSALAMWWREIVERLEKLKEDGVDAHLSGLINPVTAQRMASEWDLICRGSLWYHRKVASFGRILASSAPSPSRHRGNSTDSAPLAIPHPGMVTSMALGVFCEHLLTSPIIHSRIESIRLRRSTGIFHHEFLMIHLTDPDDKDFWLRLERAGDTADSNQLSAISKFPPIDNAQVARAEDVLIREKSDVKVELRFRPTADVTLYELRQLLWFFVEESTVYSLLWQNCRFFCSVVLEILSEEYPCEAAQGLRPIKAKYCRDARDRIKSKFNHWAGTGRFK